MNESRLKWLYHATLVMSGVLVGQMLIYGIQHLYRLKPIFNVFDLCVVLFKGLHVPAPIAWNVVNAIILYTFGALVWMAAEHALNSIKAKKLVSLFEDPLLTLQYRAHYQLRDRQIHVISYPDPIAMTIGLWKPRVILSTGLIRMLEANELHAVIEHEKCHLEHRDPLAIFMLSMISNAMWYIPIFNWVADKYPIMIEIKADKYAITQMEQSVDLGSALLKLLKQVPTPRITLSHASFAESSMNVRIMHILDPQMKLSFKWPLARIIISLLTIILLVGLI
ncbi:BlaR1 peptidase M56 [Paenibacillus sp. yr247]|uniref:M56 family metallopeptidase n=1 Tax=Paenibacillus sp. yr247 TaxID=1761880 RepID=UPI00088BC41B|nr:M56 family metallopeptidase [Paenibacillus sp. yr247]SDO01472.1 BlaR1 peptidase M56 [Paenibacillus sp. yr247]